ncbi:hypothetical protein POPTR_017G147900v4 [Populus trichocarpa]|uniref:CNNM transmembrane domain-containing protein n=1 Tax=Populus trichocarpa TaxID=3694 RepID=A0A3N7H7A6_POPTR|nr:DUF21 domain-containing protein At5g52790 isoform X3 [Populus trichocarpa]RQP02392.1 hypothetical protein POPTR_017G147900v4 [Populus trichocarpa]|eukprot:XP_024445206.1 DUF21 domain-containing protein At5g52790 isoform X3 [Populus trichocarpa]
MAANDVPCCEPMFWTYLIICMALVSFAGLMSGLTLGLMSLTVVDLEVLIKAGQPQERKNAEKILPIVKNQHLLLCTLLIGNALAMEIIPQAVCSRYGLSIGAKLSIVVRFIVIVLFPLAYPISKLLDWILGEKHSALLRRAELKTLVDMHGNEAGKGGELTHDETTIITGALDLTQKTAKDAMTPISETFSLDINCKLDEKTMGLIIRKGHSRVPIYTGNPTNIIGLILVKNLIRCRPEDETPIRDLTIRRIPRVPDLLPLYDIMNQFQKGHSHMAVVVKSKNDANETAQKANYKPTMLGKRVSGSYQLGQKDQFIIPVNSPSVYSSGTDIESPKQIDFRNLRDNLHPKLQNQEHQHGNLSHEELEFLSASDEEVIGVITLEDVMEELIQEEILDETDEYVDVHNKITINMIPPRRSPGAGTASPVSPYHQSPVSPILLSPIPPYAYSPFIRPTLYASPPAKSVPNSPAHLTGSPNYSPSSNKVSRKSYEKLRRPDGM